LVKVPLKPFQEPPEGSFMGRCPKPHKPLKRLDRNFYLPAAPQSHEYGSANEGPGKSFPWQGFGDRVPEKKEIPKEISFGIIFIWEIIL